MTASIFYFPDPELARTFRTYANYFESLANAIEGDYGYPPWKGAAEFPAASDPFKRIQRRKNGPIQTMVRSLRLSWALEFQIQVSGWVIDDAIPYLLPASFTNAYYSVYHCLRALFSAMGQQIPLSHTAGLNAVADLIARGLFPSPWNVTCKRVGTAKDCYEGLPSAAELVNHHSLASPTFEARWTILCRLLRTTREREIQRQYDVELQELQKREPDRVRLGPGARENIDQRLRATHLFDVFWRMRTRSHYQDVDAFLRGITDGSEARRFYENLQSVVTASLAILEALIVAYRGPGLLREAAGVLQQGDHADIFNEGIGQRLEFFGA